MANCARRNPRGHLFPPNQPIQYSTCRAAPENPAAPVNRQPVKHVWPLATTQKATTAPIAQLVEQMTLNH